MSIAASGTVAVSGAGAGAHAANTTTNSVEASIRSAEVSAGGDILVDATDTSAISATLVSAAVGVSGSGTVAASVSIAVTVAENDIGSTLLATIDSSEVTSTGGTVDVSAYSEAEILAIGVAAAISAGGAGGVSIQGAGSGVVGFNTITNTIEASIVGSTVTAAGDVTVDAEDHSHILAELLAASIGAGGAGTVSVNVAISATVADNNIGGSLLATINDSTVNTTGGAVTVDAFADNTIQAFGQAVGVSAGGAGAVSVNVALSAVVATNIISNSVEASIHGSSVAANHASNGLVTVNAQDLSDIFAVLTSASISAGGAGTVSANVAGAFVYASNALTASTDFDWNNDGVIDSRDIHAGVAILTKLRELQSGEDGILGNLPGEDGELGTVDDVPTGADDLTIDDAIDALGNLYVFADGQPDSAYKAALKSLIGSSFDINGDGDIDYRDLLLTSDTSDDVVLSNSVVATVDASTIDTAGAVTVSASNYDAGIADGMSITSIGVAVGIAAGGAVGVSINVAGSAVFATADMSNVVEASITGGSVVNADSVEISAIDGATVESTLVAASVAIGGAGAVSLGLSLALSIAEVSFGTVVQATIADSDVTATTGDVTLTALSEGSVDALGVAVGVTFNAAGGVSGSASAAGAIADVTSTNLVAALINAGSDVDAPSGSVVLTATDETAIHNEVVGVSVSGAFAVGSSIALAVAFAEATVSLDGTARTRIDDSKVHAGGNVELTSLADSAISATGTGVAISLSAGVGFALSGAGAGAVVTNTIGQTVQADILASNTDDLQGVTAAGSVLLSATDSITSTADATAASVSVAISYAPAALAISAAVATNTLAGLTSAGINDSFVRANTGALTVAANSESQLITTPEAHAIAAAIGFGGAGAGASATNVVTRTTEAYVRNGSDARALAGLMTVEAHDRVKATADVNANSIAGGFVALAVGVALADNLITSTTTASIENSTARSGGGDLLIQADSVMGASDVVTTADASALAIGFGAAVVGARAGTTPAGTTTLSMPGRPLQVLATSTFNADASPTSVGLGLLGGNANTFSEALISGGTLAYIGEAVTVNASTVNVKADSTETANANNIVFGLSAGFTANITISDATIDSDTEAFTGARAGTTPTPGAVTDINATGALTIRADADRTATASGSGGGAGGVTVNVFLPESDVSGSVRAYAGEGSDLSAPSVGIIAEAPVMDAFATVSAVGISAFVGVAVLEAKANVTAEVEAFVGAQAGNVTTAASTPTISTGRTDHYGRHRNGRGGRHRLDRGDLWAGSLQDQPAC